jgi:Ca-activated chloride channel homolog
MTREEAQSRLEAYALGELSTADRERVEEWLAKDAALAQDFQLLSELTSVLGEGLRGKPEVELPALARARIRWRAWRPLGRPKAVFALPLTAALALFSVFMGNVNLEPHTMDDAAEPSQLEPPAGSEVQAVESAEPLRAPARARRPPRAPPLALPRPNHADTDRFDFGFSPEQSPALRVDGFRSAAEPRRRPLSRASELGRFLDAEAEPVSTFSIDVDTASYARLRQTILSGRTPSSADARIEELVNYFHYDYPAPTGKAPVSISVDAARTPWAPEESSLVRIGLRARDPGPRSTSNLVFLIDVSASMSPEDRLPLLKRALGTLTRELSGRDWVSIVVYAGRTAVLLEPTRGSNQEVILRTLEALSPHGSTNGSGGLQMAYDLARRHFIRGGVNRVVLATDGDFNLGIADPDELQQFIEEQAQSGVFLSVLGFGASPSGDERLDLLANHGNGNYAYIDSEQEADRVLSQQLRSTLQVVAKDVKVQVTFDPHEVESYRLLGYDNRRLQREDFANDDRDAGDLGAATVVTALYELKTRRDVNARKLLSVDVRYKLPTEEHSRLLQGSGPSKFVRFDDAPRDLRFAAAVCAFGMLIRRYPDTGIANYDLVEQWAEDAIGGKDAGERRQFVQLVHALADTPTCNPPFYVHNGIRKVKPECL